MSKISSAHQTVTAYTWCHSKAALSRVKCITGDTEEKKRNPRGDSPVLVKFLISSLPTDRSRTYCRELAVSLKG
jgi:hypothetical protein